MRSGAPPYPFRTPTEPAIFLSEMRQTGLGNAGRRDEEQAWHKNPYPPVKPASAPESSQKRSEDLFPRQMYLSSENALGGLTGRFRGVLGSMRGFPHGSLQRTEAVIAVIVPVHHAAQMMLAGETALVTQRPGIVIGTTTLPCFCSRCDWHAEVKQSSMRTARTVIFRQAFGITFLPSCSKVQAGRRGR